MIYYVAKRAKFNTLAVQLIYLFPELQQVMRLVPYERLHILGSIDKGVLIWSDLDRMTQDEEQAAMAMEKGLAISAPGLRQLNSPSTSLRRFDLLRRLAAIGWNPFDVYRLNENPKRYPVFLRAERGFTNRPPILINDEAALRVVLRDLKASDSPAGVDMIVEFAGRPAPDGYYRKYAAYRIGDRIFPQHCMISPNWFIKAEPSFPAPAYRREHLLYFHENPHRERLRQIFDEASIDYGRIDYTVIDGELQTFEINTNPTVIGNIPQRGRPDERPYAQAHACALLALSGAIATDDGSPDAQVVARNSLEIVQSLQKDLRHRRKLHLVERARSYLAAVLHV